MVGLHQVLAIMVAVSFLPQSAISCRQYRVGGGCSIFCPCAGDMRCEAFYHVCRKPGGEGESCHATKPCGSGLQCEAGHHVCRRKGKKGDPCHATRECADGHSCLPVLHQCEQNDLEEGDICATEFLRGCKKGLYCDAPSGGRLTLDPSPGKCRKLTGRY